MAQVLKLIQEEALPILRKCSLAGFAHFQSKHEIFDRSTKATDMFIDILTDRGFSVSYVCDTETVPTRFDLQTGDVHCEKHRNHRFRITFEKHDIREVAKRADQLSSKCASASCRTQCVHCCV